MPLVAGVDSSTSACKVEVRDAATGELVASGRASHPSTSPPRSEQHPSAWLRAFNEAFGQAGRSVDAIAIAGQQHGLVVADDAGRVLRPAKLWNDTESALDADELVDTLGAAAWAEACGSVPRASFTITKLRWLKRVEPDVFRRVARVALPHDWLTAQLTGGHSTDRGDASGTGWWSPARGSYCLDLLALVDDAVAWEIMLPTVLGPSDVAGAWGDVLVAAGTGDNMAAALGLGLRPGDLALSLGTSGTAFTVSADPTADAAGHVAGFADATGRFLPLVCTLNATKVTAAVGRLLGVDDAGLDALALAAPGGAGGAVVVPYFDGERTPNLPEATGSILGLRSDVTPEQLARAAIEGVICNLLAGADHLPAGDGRILLVGGGAKSRAYRQIAADLIGRPVAVPDTDEVVARGAAIQAAAALADTTVDEVAAAWPLGLAATVEPDRSVDHNAIRAAYERAVE